MPDTERASMVWPAGVKDKIKAAAGEQTMTEFVLDAIQVHLGESGNQAALEKQLRETEFFAQRVADLAVMGGSQGERFAALMELEFPSWISTEGWPDAAAGLVGIKTTPVTVEPVAPKPVEDVPADEQAPVEEIAGSPGSEPEVGAAPARRDPVPAEADEQPWRITESPSPRSDLFARLKGKLDDVPGLTTASEIPVPPKPAVDPVAAVDPDEVDEALTVYADPMSADDDDQAAEGVPAAAKCPNCGDELIDGECWTCS